MALLTARLTGRRPAALLLCGLLAAAAAVGAPPKSDPNVESALKAAVLFNFTKFIDWPADGFPDEKSPFNLCLLGDDPIGASLDAIVVNESWNGRPLAVRRLPRGADPHACQILFFGRTERERQAENTEVLAGLRGANVLTVGESDRFLAEGGHIRFFLDANRVRFEVNLAAVERTRIKISSKLLRLAKLRQEEGD
ncbi:MAG TPA: YfiR family protein [Thermoanaerobaculia bacterium]|nr:YfiR family protein [Thermoanaerobaculia bacterium]